MSPDVVQRAGVKHRLLAAAVELIPERGWSAVSTRVLAERAGVSPSVVHYHFASMSVLLTEAVITAMRRTLDEVGGALDEVERAEDLPAALIGSVDQHSGVDSLSVLFIEAYLASTRDEQLRHQMVAILNELRGRLSGLLADHGVPEPDASAAVLAASIDGMLLHRGLGAGPAGSVAAKVLQRLVT